MTKRQSRLLFVFTILFVASVAVYLGIKAFNENLLYFYTPEDVVKKKTPIHKSFRLGGLVLNGSVQRDGLTTRFTISDTVAKVNVVYRGILPDLFRQGQGIIATGKMSGTIFSASEVLAKHDENYMPPEVAAALKVKRK